MYTADDLRELARITRKFVKPYGRAAWRAWASWSLAGLMFFGILVLGWLFPRPPNPASSSSTSATPPIFALIFWPTALVLMVCYLIWSFSNRYKRLLRENPSAQIVRAVEFSGTGVTMSQPSTVTNWTWDAFAEMVESDSVFALRINGDRRHFLLIPKRAVPATDLQPFRSLVEAKTELETVAFPVLRTEKKMESV